MGLLDQLVGQVLGQQQTGTGTSSSGMGSVLTQLLGGQGSGQNQGGGITGLIEKFRASGLGHIADSWVSNGPNLPVSSDQLRSVLGPQQTQQMAAQSGLSVENLLSQLARHLPGLVDRITPNGTVPSGGASSELLET